MEINDMLLWVVAATLIWIGLEIFYSDDD